MELKVIERIKNMRKKVDNVVILESIKLDNISKKYGDIQALENVSYSANEERLALLGHNGAGKSTTFGMLSAQLTQN